MKLNAIKMNLTECDNLPKGTSKFFGEPDLPKDANFDIVENVHFLCQIDCEAIAKYDLDKRLPKKGILYFFYDFEEAPYEADEEKGGAYVIYCDVTKEELDDERILEATYEPYTQAKIDFIKEEQELGDDFPKGSDGNQLLGYPADWSYGSDDYQTKHNVLLLQIDPLEIEPFLDTNMLVDGFLYFFIKESNLQKRKFSKAFVQVEHS